MERKKTVWTARAVSRPTAPGYAMVAIKAVLCLKTDVFETDCAPYMAWHRRGAAYFDTRAECVSHNAKTGHPVN